MIVAMNAPEMIVCKHLSEFVIFYSTLALALRWCPLLSSSSSLKP